MTIPARNQTPDTAVRETANAKAQRGTHLAPNAASDALFVQRGTGTLGDAQGALDVQPGTGLVAGTEHTISSLTAVDIATGDGSPRRDVVYLDSSGALAVAKGTPNAFAWDAHLSDDERTIENAYRPAPPDLADTEGLALAMVTVPANARTLPSGAITELRAEAPGGTGTVNDKAIQSALDGRLVPVADGVGVLDAIDPTATNTPVQDAIDVINAGNGYGAIYYPPTTVESPGNISDSGGIRHLGDGRHATIECTDLGGDLFTFTSNAEGSYSYWSGIELDGGSRADRTAGSAFHFTTGAHINFNFGQMAFRDWGPDPVIHCDGAGPYGSTWENVFINSYTHDGPLLRASGFFMFGMDIGVIGAGPNNPNTYVVEIDNAEFGGRIGVINCGGASGRVLRVDDAGRAASIDVGWINSEPNDPQTTDRVVHLADTGGVRIGHVTTTADLTVDNVVTLAGSGNSSRGPANKRLGTIEAKGTVNNAPITVQAAAESPSWYWGPRSDIDYGGYSAAAVIPLADAGYRSTATKATLSSVYSLASGSYATIPFDTAMYGGANLDTTNNRYTASVDGIYTVTAAVRFNSGDSAARFSLRLIKNAGTASEAEVAPASMNSGANGAYTSPPYTQDVALAAGDTLTIRGYQDTGAAVDIDPASTVSVRKVSETP